MKQDQRIVCWFSEGAASACATKIKILENNASANPLPLVVVKIHLADEYDDGGRFKGECETWFGQKIITIMSEKFNGSVDDVIKKTRYMSGPAGARCTTELKKTVRLEWQRFDDIHVFGMTIEEKHRINRIIDGEADILLDSPLINHNMKKTDCFHMLRDAGIDLPMMYKFGFHNNNCIGCLKAAGAGYWNLIRKYFPEVFWRRARQEEILGVAMVIIAVNTITNKHPEVWEQMAADKFKFKIKTVKRKNKLVGGGFSHTTQEYLRIPLRYLPESAGTMKDLDIGDCGFFCEKKGDDENVILITDA